MKPGLRLKRSRGIAQIAAQPLEPGQAALVAQRVHGWCDGPMPNHRRAFGACFVGGHLEMRAQLRLEIGVAAAVAEATRPLSHLGHQGRPVRHSNGVHLFY